MNAPWQALSPTRVHHVACGCAFGVSEPGRLREGNQDNLLIDESLGLLMVGDGMGGHADGDLASRDALGDIHRVILRQGTPLQAADRDTDATVDARTALLPRAYPVGSTQDTAPSTAVQIDHILSVAGRAIVQANAHLYARNRRRGLPDGTGMGTTVTGLWRPERAGPMAVFHVGDSRLYRWRSGTLRQLTTDHSVYQPRRAQGAAAPAASQASRHLLWQALGPAPVVVPQLQAVRPQRDDVYLLCTDGLHGMASNEAIACVLKRASREHLPQTCAGLLALANRLGGHDNVTALLMWCDQ